MSRIAMIWRLKLWILVEFLGKTNYWSWSSYQCVFDYGEELKIIFRSNMKMDRHKLNNKTQKLCLEQRTFSTILKRKSSLSFLLQKFRNFCIFLVSKYFSKKDRWSFNLWWWKKLTVKIYTFYKNLENEDLVKQTIQGIYNKVMFSTDLSR